MNHVALLTVVLCPLLALANEDEAPQPAPRPKLVGLMLSTSQALLWDEERGEYVLKRAGDEVGGARIVAIEAERLVLDGGQALELSPAPIKMTGRRPRRMPAVIVAAPGAPAPVAATPVAAPPVAAPPVAATPVAAPPVAPVAPAPVAAAPVAAPVAAPEPPGLLIRRAELDHELADFSALAEKVQLQRGSRGGFVLAALLPGCFFERIGLRAGDVVVRIDGRPINAPEDASAAYAWLRVTDRFSVDIVRDGRMLTLRYVLG